jgi:hypothetical protein
MRAPISLLPRKRPRLLRVNGRRAPRRPGSLPRPADETQGPPEHNRRSDPLLHLSAVQPRCRR